MRTFIVAHDGQYMPGDMPAMEVLEFETFRELMDYMGFLQDEDEENPPQTDDDLIYAFHNSNGDGSAFWLVKELVCGAVEMVDEFYQYEERKRK